MTSGGGQVGAGRSGHDEDINAAQAPARPNKGQQEKPAYRNDLEETLASLGGNALKLSGTGGANRTTRMPEGLDIPIGAIFRVRSSRTWANAPCEHRAVTGGPVFAAALSM